jgi:hypothetical protein
MKRLLVLGSLMLLAQAGFSQNPINVSGTYKTDFGKLTLTQTGATVTGSYTYPDSGGTAVEGSLSGSLKGNTLTFTWVQNQSGGKATGKGSFVFAKDGKSYEGTWTDSKGESGTWSGKRE